MFTIRSIRASAALPSLFFFVLLTITLHSLRRRLLFPTTLASLSAMSTTSGSTTPAHTSPLGRPVHQIITSHRQLEGGGFEIRRPFPSAQLQQIDPFLLFDHLGPTQHEPHEAIGAPDHPHRGFETITYIKQGSMEHLDSFGHAGQIKTGGVQWMTAGSGLIHSEMPSHELLEKGGTLEGFQIWLNLPASAKSNPPRYQELDAEQIPEGVSDDGKVRVKVVSGESLGVKAAISTHIPVYFLDVMMQPNATFQQPIPNGYTAVAYAYNGRGYIGANQKPIKEGQCAHIDTSSTAAADGEHITITTEHDSASFLVLAGRPIKEPMARYGPFVMNTQAEIRAAFDDYQNGKMGHLEGGDERHELTEKAKRVKEERLAREKRAKKTEL